METTLQRERKRLDGDLKGEKRFAHEIVAAAKADLARASKSLWPVTKTTGVVRLRRGVVNFFAEFKAVHARQLHVEENHIVSLLAGLGQGCLAIHSKIRLAECFFQRERHGLTADQIIVHDQKLEGTIRQ